MADQFQYDVFLSYHPQDEERIRRLAGRLRDAGLRVWFDAWAIEPGQERDEATERGLASARTLVLCLSPALLAEDWLARERTTAPFRDPAEGQRFLPLLLETCDPPEALRGYQAIDYRAEGEAAFDDLLAACQAESPEPPPRALEAGEPLAVLERRLEGHTNWVWSVAVSPDGTWAVSGSRDKTLKIWDLEMGECRATLEGHTDEVNSVAITPDGERILSSSDDGTIRVWDTKHGRPIYYPQVGFVP